MYGVAPPDGVTVAVPSLAPQEGALEDSFIAMVGQLLTSQTIGCIAWFRLIPHEVGVSEKACHDWSENCSQAVLGEILSFVEFEINAIESFCPFVNSTPM